MSRTGIEWSDATWNPATGCTKVSAGCANCYAERWAKRTFSDRPFTDVRCHPDRLDQPLHWRKPRKIFIASMGDLFHERIPFQFIESVMLVIEEEAAHHTYQILTKRPQRMLEFCSWYLHRCSDDSVGFAHRWPAHAWLGVSVEDQKTADERIPILLQTPAAVKFVSIEPCLSHVDLKPKEWLPCGPRCTERGFLIDWVICGGESGPRARPMRPDWVRSVHDQCQAAGVPFFFKQWGEWTPGTGLSGMWAYSSEMTPPLSKVFSARDCHDWGEGYVSIRVGKKRAGRLLDGREWNEYPQEKQK